MSTFFQALLSGAFFTFLLDFFFFLGLKKNYIDFFEIDEYYNIFFFDHQNLPIFLGMILLLGFVTVYVRINLIRLPFMVLLFIGVSSLMLQPIGFKVGEFLFMKKDVVLKNKKFTFRGDIRYKNRGRIIFYDYDLKKQIILETKELIK